MADAKIARAWDHTATLACYIIRMNGDPKKVKNITPASLHPYEKKQRRVSSGIEINSGNIQILKKIFVDGFSEN